MDFSRDGGSTLIGEIQQNIRNLSQQVQSLDAFIPRLSDSSETGMRNRERFSEMMHEAQLLSKETNRLMREMVEASNNDRSLRVHRERLQNEYISVLNRLQGSQRRAAQAEKSSMQQVREAAEQDAESAKQAVQSDGQGPFQVQRQQQVNLQEIKERQQALQQLEQDIGDVNQIFADLARIVHEQGEIFDSIEANVESAQIHVQQGAENVTQAVYYNQKARQKKLMLCIFLLLLVFIIGLTIYLAR